jgi:predicted lactoylglutathione lyase
LTIVSKSNKVILFGNFFFKKEISDTTKNTEAIVALSAQSREEVDQMMDKVVDAGGRESRDPHSKRIMHGCMDDILRILMDIFGEYFTWMKVP